MDELLSTAVVSRRSWSKSLHKKKSSNHLHRREQSVTLPVLARRPSSQHLHNITSNNSLHAFLDGNDRESYSRSQLRAMASSTLLSTNNNNLASTNARIHNSAKRLAPLDPTSFEKTNTQPRRTLPGTLQAAINEVLAMRNTGEQLSERGESCDESSKFDEPETPAIPKVKRTSPSKSQLQSRRPEWSRYIRRIMMTKGIRGSTLARYRRLVGIVARKNLNQSVAGAAERVVRYRLEFRSATLIQTLILAFLNRRRQTKERQRHRAAAMIQCVWRRILQLQRQRRQAEIHRLAKIERLLHLSATRSIQRSYRKYRHTCYLREEERQQQQQASMLQKARLKLLQRYQSWREKDKARRNLKFTSVEESDDLPSINTEKEFDISPEQEQSDSCVKSPRDPSEVIATFVSISKDEPAIAETSHQDILDRTEQASDPIDVMQNDERLDDQETAQLDDFVALPQQEQGTKNYGNLAIIDETQFGIKIEAAVATPTQDNQISIFSCSLSCSEIKQSPSEVATSRLKANTEPEDNESDGNNQSSEKTEVAAVPSDPDDPQQLHVDVADVVEEESISEIGAVAAAAATASARTNAAEQITRFLLPRLQARHLHKTNAAIQIQCLVRLYLANQYMARVRLAALHSLRAQLFASWHSAQQVEKLNEQNTHDVLDQHDNEDDELDLELRGYQPSSHGVADDYLHLLPTLKGQIPPGVPLLQSSAGAPLLTLWKWSWPSEKWLSNGQ